MPVQIVLCTCPDVAVAETLARSMVEQRLAACVNLLPGVRSIYRWQGAVESAAECLLLIKTTTDCFDGLKEFIVSKHPHAVPEVVALDAVAGLDRYLDWVCAQTGPAGAGT